MKSFWPYKGKKKTCRKLRYAINKFVDCVIHEIRSRNAQPNYLGLKWRIRWLFLLCTAQFCSQIQYEKKKWLSAKYLHPVVWFVWIFAYAHTHIQIHILHITVLNVIVFSFSTDLLSKCSLLVRLVACKQIFERLTKEIQNMAKERNQNSKLPKMRKKWERKTQWRREWRYWDTWKCTPLIPAHMTYRSEMNWHTLGFWQYIFSLLFRFPFHSLAFKWHGWTSCGLNN